MAAHRNGALRDVTRALFGGWRDALRAAGIDPVRRGRPPKVPQPEAEATTPVVAAAPAEALLARNPATHDAFAPFRGWTDMAGARRR